MADTVNTQVLLNGNREYIANFTWEYVDTGESAVQKVDISTLTNANGDTATHATIDRIDYSITAGMNVVIEFNATTNDEVAALSGDGCIDWTKTGGVTDPQSTGSDGDIVFSTVGHGAGDTYTITLWMRPKA